MLNRRARSVWLGLLLTCVCLAPLALAQEQTSPNLLADGDFEAPPTWPMQDGIGEVQVAPGWRAYYLDTPPAYVQLPANCDKLRVTECYWMRPEFRDNTSFANRIRSGERSQKYFSYGRMHEAGLMQQVRGIPPGARVRFSIWMQAWMCYNPSDCGKDGVRSDQPSDMHLRVGIDPLGGTDPFTGTVVWAAEQPAWDKFVLFVVETAAISDTVTVMTHSRAEWPWARTNNDVYLDDASLVIVGAYSTTPVIPLTLTAAPTTPLYPTLLTTTRTVTGTPTVTATATPFPAGAITYTVRMGDTLFDVALKHGLPVADLLALNGFSTSTQLLLNQPVLVQITTLTPTPTPSPTEPLPTPTASPTAILTPALSPTSSPPLELIPVQTVRPVSLPIWLILLTALTGVGFLIMLLVLLARRRRQS